MSDKFHAAQVRYKPANAPSEVHMFDDIGCAVIWLEGQAWKDALSTEIWVNDYKTGSWIDARKASYVLGQQTPMQYGLGAHLEAVEGSINFQAAREQIFKVENYFNQHGAR
ncbi:MAG: nitrous oxide reductase accessory protein NosL [Candidatus Polarisedimenticolaceae bacterium]|nr:nitrous oxide reductase accessory protein NosL [Candidatus Polarisedimenticolaceae bacterium]